MADASLFHQYLRPVKSAVQYGAELDQQEGNRLAMEGQRQQNAMQAATMQQQGEARRQNAIVDAARATAARTAGGDPVAYAKALRTSGQPTLLAEADARDKADLERKKTEAETGKTDAETLTKRLDAMKFLAGSVLSNPTPQSAAMALDMFERMTGQEMPEERAALAQLQTPEQVAKWAQGHAMSADQALSHQRQTAADAETARANRAREAGQSAATAATRDNAAATRDAAKTKDLRDTEMKLADDYRVQSKNFKEVADAYKRVTTALKTATTSAPATLAAATSFMKMLDPGSVVRESELGMAMQATGVFDRATNYLNVLLNGKTLTPDQAKDFESIAGQILEAAQQGQQQLDTSYKQRATQYGLRPEMIVQDLGQSAPAGAPPPDLSGRRSTPVIPGRQAAPAAGAFRIVGVK